MGRRIRVLSAAAGCALRHRPRVPGRRSRSSPSPAWCRRYRAVSHTMSTIASAGVSGIVIDEHESPLAGAMVSFLGATTAMTLTDASGRFSLQALPPGDYIAARASHRVRCVAARERPPRRRAHRRPSACSFATSKSRSRRPASWTRSRPGRSSPPVSACPPRVRVRHPAERRRSLPHRYGVAAAPSHAQHPEGLGEHASRSRTTSRILEPTRSSGGRHRSQRALFRRPAVLRRSEPAHDQRVRPRRAVFGQCHAARDRLLLDRRADRPG